MTYFIFLLTYIFMFAFNSIFTVLGYITIPPMALLHKYTTTKAISKINGREILIWKYKFMWIWGNDEDGLIGASEFRDSSVFVRIVYWCMWRNPTNNIRFIPYLSVKPDPKNINFKLFGSILDFEGNEIKLDDTYKVLDDDRYRFTTLTWQGYYSNLRFQFKTRIPEIKLYKLFGLIPIPIKISFPYKIVRLWIGFKLYPEDKFGLWELDYRRYGAGFARQLKRIYPRENK